MQPLPKTVTEAVDILLSQMPEDFKRALRSKKKNELISYHFGWGLSIRSVFNLWDGNNELLKDTGTFDADDASMIIIEAVWQRLQQET